MGSSGSKKANQKVDVKNEADTSEEPVGTPVTTRKISVRPATTEGSSQLNIETDRYTNDEQQLNFEAGQSHFKQDQPHKHVKTDLQKHYHTEAEQNDMFQFHGNSLRQTGKAEGERGLGQTGMAEGERGLGQTGKTEGERGLGQTGMAEGTGGPVKSSKHLTTYSSIGGYRNEDHKIASITREMQELREQRDIMATINKDMTRDIQNLRNKLVQKDTEINELRTRLSRVASERLTDNNPNIADLSDPNRPIKIAEWYNELYSNEWSDAFEDLTTSGHTSEEDAIFILLELIKDIYGMCFNISRTQLGELKTSILMFTGNTQMTTSLSGAMKAFKDERKKMFKSFLTSLNMETNKIRDTKIAQKKEQTKKLQKYLDTSTELCWLMCIQDPPIHLFTDCKKGTHLDETSFTTYTVRGITVDYLVWPALHLHENGPVLQKGVAQAKALKKNEMSATNKTFPESSQLSKKNLQRMGHHESHTMTSVETAGEATGLQKIISTHGK